MSLTIYECPDCGNGPETTPLIPGVSLRGDNRRRCPCGYIGEFVPVRLFREEDVRPLYEAAASRGGLFGGDDALARALRRFPAPEEWKP